MLITIVPSKNAQSGCCEGSFIAGCWTQEALRMQNESDWNGFLFLQCWQKLVMKNQVTVLTNMDSILRINIAKQWHNAHEERKKKALKVNLYAA